MEIVSQYKLRQGALQIVFGEATLILPLEGIIDVAEEKARLEKEIAHQESEISRFDMKLENKKFITKAPEEVVTEQREKRETAMDELGRLHQASARLEAL